MKLKEFTILQITPSDGFNAVFANDDATVYSRPLACWALIRRTIELTDSDWDKLEELNLPMTDVVSPKRGEPLTITRVEGMSSEGSREISPCENDEYFLGYAGPKENPLDFQDRARELIDSFMDEDGDDKEDENNEEYERLPQALSHLSVQVQERIRKGTVPQRWEQAGWLEFMRRFGDLSGG
jgi:hypothetical protein